MNYTNTKTDQFIKQMKGSRVPSHMGSFSSLLSQNMRIVDLSEFTRGLNEGKLAGTEEGFNLGLEKGLKEFIINGENQILVDKKDGKVYTFSNNAQLLKSEKIGPMVKEFTAHEISKPEVEKYQNFINNYVEKIGGSNKENDVIDFEEQIKKVGIDLKERKKNIQDQYSKFHDGDFKIDVIDEDNLKVIDSLKTKQEIIDANIQSYATKKQNMEKNLQQSPKKRGNQRKAHAYTQLKTDLQNLTTAQDKINSDLATRNNIQESLDNYIKDNNLFKERQIINDSIETLKNTKSKVKTEFTNLKNRSTAMMLTDNFNIYNVDQIRKIYPKNTGPVEEDIFAKIKDRKVFALDSKDIIETVADYRTNKQQITLQNLDSQLLIPQQKVTLTPDLYLYMKYPKEGEPLEIEGSIKKSKYSKKSTKK